MFVLGFSSGLPLTLSGSTLQAWATVTGVSLQHIGFLGLVGIAYSLKFLWAPFIDRYVPFKLGRRRGWMLLTQVALALGIVAMSRFNPQEGLLYLALLAVIVAFLSATQDIALDAYTADVLHHEERGTGTALKMLGYRIAMLISGGMALILADSWIGWGNTYVLMGGLMLLGVCATVCAPEPEKYVPPPRTLTEAVVAPMRDFFTRPGSLSLLLLIVFYKLGDAFAMGLSTPFLLRAGGFTPTEVGVVNKGLGLVATLVGALLGGGLVMRLGLYRALMGFGFLQAISNLGYWFVAVWPGHLPLMVAAVGLENLCGGLGTTAFGALLLALCTPKFSATQFALLSALAATGRIYLAGPLTPVLVESVGWPVFFLITVVISLPGLLFLRWHRRDIEALDQ